MTNVFLNCKKENAYVSKKRIQQLRQQRNDEAHAAEEAQRTPRLQVFEREAQRQAIEKEGRDEHRNIQAQLLEDLRQKGIVGMIEEATDQEIEPIFISPEEMAENKKWRDSEKGRRTRGESNLWRIRISNERYQIDIQKFQERERKEWQVSDISYPSMSEDSVWDDSVRIRLFRRRFEPGYYHDSGDYVTITFQQNQDLTVKGKDVTFEGSLAGDFDRDVVEIGIARAMFEPKRVMKPTLSTQSNM